MILNNNMVKSIKKMVLTVKKVVTINFHWLIDQYQSIKNRPFAASHSSGTKLPCWRAKLTLGQDKQKTYIIWNGNFLCLSCPNATFALQHGGFLPREWLAAKVPLSIVTYWLSYMKSSREPLTQIIWLWQLIQMSTFISQPQFTFTTYNVLQCLPIKTNYSNLYIGFNTQKVLTLLEPNSW